jgi:hypothetical protein
MKHRKMAAIAIGHRRTCPSFDIVRLDYDTIISRSAGHSDLLLSSCMSWAPTKSTFAAQGPIRSNTTLMPSLYATFHFGVFDNR